MIPYNQSFISLNEWEELSKTSPQIIQNPNGLIFEDKFEEENSNQKIITLTKRLTLFERIGAFFQLLAQQLFNRDPHIQALLPEAWKALIAGNYVQSYIYQEASYWDSLPNDISKVIKTYLSPSDVVALSQTSTKLLDDHWKSIAEKIPCSLNPQLPSKQQVQTFISKLKQKSEFLQNLPFAAPLIKSNKVDDLCILQKLIKARDTQIVWKALARLIYRPNEVPHLNTRKNIKGFLNISKKFTAWCRARLPSPTQLTWLYLRDKQLTSLPSEIGSLTHLQKLYLDSNQLASLPTEIGNLIQLESLTLEGNPLTFLPTEIGNLTKLERLTLDFNQLTSLPTEISNLTKLESLTLEDNPLTPKEPNQRQSLPVPVFHPS